MEKKKLINDMNNFINKKANAKTANWLNKESITELAMSIADVAVLRYEFDNDDKACEETSYNLQEELRIAENHLYHVGYNCKCRLAYLRNRPF
tara:strand:+ start:35 stop:313 length:279 start_codon:yes stop_codon:yes gene_type:complete